AQRNTKPGGNTMSVKAAASTEFPVTEWETFEGETYGYDAEGTRVIEISAQVRETAWQRASTVRGWAVKNVRNDLLGAGNAAGLRAATKAALAVRRAS